MESFSRIRKPAVAGSFYPQNQETLLASLQKLYAGTQRIQKSYPKALIVPHAGIVYSGQTAAHSFAQVMGADYRRVIVLAPSHHAFFSGASIADVDAYETPLGLVKLSPIVSDLLDYNLFESHPTAHKSEHSIEVELPFLQMIFEDFELVPILVGSGNSFENLKQIADVLRPYIDDQTLVVVSTDFTHYGQHYGSVPFTENVSENIEKTDEKAFDFITDKDSQGIFDYIESSDITIDGQSVLPLVAEIFPETDVQLFDYTQSGDITGDYDLSVSYAAFGFYEPAYLNLNEDQKQELLDIARKTLEESFDGGSYFIDKQTYDRFRVKQGVFVTLKKNGDLRGCIGYIEPHLSLYDAVQKNTINAAYRDSRFEPVSKEELDDILIEISILSVPRLMKEKTASKRFMALKPGVDGLILEKGMQTATFLPQVWDHLPDKTEFLEHLCQKVGLSNDCWKDEDVQWYTYQADHFQEEDRG